MYSTVTDILQYSNSIMYSTLLTVTYILQTSRRGRYSTENNAGQSSVGIVSGLIILLISVSVVYDTQVQRLGWRRISVILFNLTMNTFTKTLRCNYGILILMIAAEI